MVNKNIGDFKQELKDLLSSLGNQTYHKKRLILIDYYNHNFESAAETRANGYTDKGDLNADLSEVIKWIKSKYEEIDYVLPATDSKTYAASIGKTLDEVNDTGEGFYFILKEYYLHMMRDLKSVADTYELVVPDIPSVRESQKVPVYILSCVLYIILNHKGRKVSKTQNIKGFHKLILSFNYNHKSQLYPALDSLEMLDDTLNSDIKLLHKWIRIDDSDQPRIETIKDYLAVRRKFTIKQEANSAVDNIFTTLLSSTTSSDYYNAYVKANLITYLDSNL